MIQVIAGKKGSGKTKRLSDLTNATARDAIHDVIFLDDDNRYMYDVDHNVRFINAADYNVRSTEMFLGFVCGILSSNYDVGTIFVDAFLKLCHTDLAGTEPIVNLLSALGAKQNVDTVFIDINSMADKAKDVTDSSNKTAEAAQQGAKSRVRC